VPKLPAGQVARHEEQLRLLRIKGATGALQEAMDVDLTKIAENPRISSG